LKEIFEEILKFGEQLDEGDIIFGKFIGELFVKVETDFDIIIIIAELLKIVVIIRHHCFMHKQC